MTPSRTAPGAAASGDAPTLAVALRRWQGRIARRRILVVAGRAALCALPVAVVLTVLARTGTLPTPVAVLAPVAVLVAVLAAGRRGPDLAATARLLDHDLALSARLTTARELEGTPPDDRSPLETTVLAEARAAADPGLKGFRVRTHERRRTVVLLVVLALTLAAALLVPLGRTTDAHPAAGGAGDQSGTAAAAGATAGTAGRAAGPSTINGTSTVAGTMHPAERRPAAPIAPYVGARAGKSAANAAETRAGLRGGRTHADANATKPPPAPTTDKETQTSGANRGVAPVRQPTGLHQTGNVGVMGTKAAAPMEGARAIAAGQQDKSAGQRAASGTPGAGGKSKGTGAATSKTGGTPASKAPAGSVQAQSNTPQGQSGTGTAVGNSRGADAAATAAAALKTLGALPLAAGFKPGKAAGVHGKQGTGTGNGDGKSRGKSEQGTGSAVDGGASSAGAVGFAFPDARSGPGLRGSLLLHYFGS